MMRQRVTIAFDPVSAKKMKTAGHIDRGVIKGHSERIREQPERDCHSTFAGPSRKYQTCGVER
jgi:hypothetical protein